MTTLNVDEASKISYQAEYDEFNEMDLSKSPHSSFGVSRKLLSSYHCMFITKSYKQIKQEKLLKYCNTVSIQGSSQSGQDPPLPFLRQNIFDVSEEPQLCFDLKATPSLIFF